MRAPLVLAIILGFTIGLAGSPSAEPGFTVIVNRHNDVRTLDRRTVAEAFLKKRTHWTSDRPIAPVDQPKSAAVRKRFSRQILGRSVEAVRAYWNQMVFSGRGVPPPEVDGDDAVLVYVGRHSGAIGYVSADVDLRGSRVRAVEIR